MVREKVPHDTVSKKKRTVDIYSIIVSVEVERDPKIPKKQSKR